MEDLNYQLIAERIDSFRIAQNLTVDQLAAKSLCSGQHISHIINARGKLSLTCLVNICKALNVSPNDILLHNVSNDGTMPQLTEDINRVFSDCTPVETKHMLSVASALKQSLRISKDIIE